MILNPVSLRQTFGQVSGVGFAQDDNHSAPLLRDMLHGLVKNRLTTLPQNIPQNIHSVHSDQYGRFCRGDVALDQHDMFGIFKRVGVDDHFEITAEAAVQGAFVDALDETLLAAAVGDQVGNRADPQIMLAGKGAKVIKSGHGACFVHDLTDHTRGRETRQTRKVQLGVGMSGVDQHAAPSSMGAGPLMVMLTLVVGAVRSKPL